MDEMDELIELEYNDVEVEYGCGGRDYWTGDYRSYRTAYVTVTIEVWQSDIEEFIGQLLSKSADKAKYAEMSDDEFYDYIHQHFDELFDKYSSEIYSHWDDTATEKANETFDVNAYDDDFGW